MELPHNIIETGIGAIIGLMGFAVKYLRDLSKDVRELTNQSHVIVTRLNFHEKTIETHGKKISDIEKSISRGNRNGKDWD